MKLVHVFFETSMQYGHQGLGEIMRKNKRTLSEDEYVVFVNKNWSAVKMLTPNNVLLHYKAKGKMGINPGTIKHLPSCVQGGELRYDLALKTVIEAKFTKSGARK